MTKLRGTKAIAALCGAAMILSLAACGAAEAPSGGTTTTTATTTKAETTPAATTIAETTTEETTTEPKAPPVRETSAEDFEYIRKNGEIIITKYIGEVEEVIIPAKIDGEPVTMIGDYAFQYNEAVESVMIPDGVTTIGQLAFANCWNLENITIPESVKKFMFCDPIVYSPFDGTPWLEKQRAENPLVIVNNVVVDGRICTRSVTIPEGVTHIADGAFYDCTTLMSVDLPKSMEKIGDFAFNGCSRLTEIVLPDSISRIGDQAFARCNSLENVTFPNHAVELGYRVFIDGWGEACPWLANKRAENSMVIVNDNLIDAYAVSGNVVIPDSVQSIAAGAFSNSDNVTSVQLPDGITKLPDNLFSYCRRLTSVMVPDSVTEIGDGAFCWCTSLPLTFSIPDGVTIIGEGAFEGCEFSSVTLPDGLKKIGARAFFKCFYLANITIPDSVTEIGEEAFHEILPLKNATLPDGLESLGIRAFYNTDIIYKGEIYFPELYDELYEAINSAQ